MSKADPPPYSPPPAGFAPPGPPPQSYPPPPQQHTVIVTQAAPLNLGPQPASVTCPSCHAQIVTTVETEANTKTHLFALLLCLLGCWPCVCIPYCTDTCQSQNHYCPNCRAYLGKFND